LTSTSTLHILNLMPNKITSSKRNLLVRIGGLLIVLLGFGQLLLNLNSESVLMIFGELLLIVCGFYLLLGNIAPKRKFTKKAYIGLAVVGVISTFLAQGIFQYYKQGAPIGESSSTIKQISYTADCNVVIELNSAVTKTLTFNDQLISKNCNDSPKPIISSDGKYAAFELRAIEESNTSKYGVSNNALFIYDASTDNWFRAYEYGAAQAENFTFSSENSVALELFYEGKLSETKQIPTSEYSLLVSTERESAIAQVAQLPEVKQWMSRFTGPNKTSTATGGKPQIIIDQYRDEFIIIHAYESIPSDKRTATFNWYKYNRLTHNVTKEL
jgi:hypothetical protein